MLTLYLFTFYLCFPVPNQGLRHINPLRNSRKINVNLFSPPQILSECECMFRSCEQSILLHELLPDSLMLASINILSDFVAQSSSLLQKNNSIGNFICVASVLRREYKGPASVFL